jgi:Na+-driven multidrug efflux pump
MIRTALPLSFGYLLQYGEWEVLTIFSAFMGPAEVAAWGILGTLWESFEAMVEGVADGGEIRVGYHLGAGRPGTSGKWPA